MIQTMSTNKYMSLNRFILRSQVLQLYRQMLRVVKEITDASHKKELTKWIQDDFKRNKHLTDEDAIKMMVMKGRMSLREIEQAIHLAR
ncbi:hypothetical protein ACJMK2_028107 [Sinanodonta woodiana]|uniref:LYR motif-containing protein 2 n=1 Tax=Sinanodonta woodiana TaxID=1069815 RepID=A0ABD3X6C3_SINWO